jgi:hypothetical protein
MGSNSSKKAPAASTETDMVLVYGQSEDGQRYGVIRQRGAEIQAGTMRPLQEGKPILGEVVRLKPREESPALFDVEVQHQGSSARGRPAKVASEDYRRGWESIWSNKRRNQALN